MTALRAIPMHSSGVPFRLAQYKHAGECTLSSAHTKECLVYHWLIKKNNEEEVQSHLPLSLSPADGTL
jgi:hypothetical protein